MSDEVSEEIMTATYRALCEHGYATVTMQDIADHSEKSKAALHYHYDTKRDLLLAFLDYLFEKFTDRMSDPPGTTPVARLLALIDTALTPPDPDKEAFGTAILELKAQAPYDEEVRTRLAAFDAYLVGTVRECVALGMDTGEIRDGDPDDIARFIVTAIDGARTKHVAIGQDLEGTRRMLHSYIESDLADGPPDGEGVPSDEQVHSE